MQCSSEYLHRWRFHNLSVQSLPVFDHLHCGKVFPYAQMEPPIFLFVPIATCSVTRQLWEGSGSFFVIHSHQVFIYMVRPSWALCPPDWKVPFLSNSAYCTASESSSAMHKVQQGHSSKMVSISHLRFATLLKLSLQNTKEFLGGLSVPAAALAACNLLLHCPWGCRGRGWGLWPQPQHKWSAWPVSTGRLFLDIASLCAPAWTSLSTAASQKLNSTWFSCLDIFRTSGHMRSDSYLMFLCFTWKFDSHG